MNIRKNEENKLTEYINNAIENIENPDKPNEYLMEINNKYILKLQYMKSIFKDDNGIIIVELFSKNKNFHCLLELCLLIAFQQ